jgi:hypothetical protein
LKVQSEWLQRAAPVRKSEQPGALVAKRRSLFRTGDSGRTDGAASLGRPKKPIAICNLKLQGQLKNLLWRRIGLMKLGSYESCFAQPKDECLI